MYITESSVLSDLEVAVYKSSYGGLYIEPKEEAEAGGKVRLTEFITVKFIKRPVEEFVPDALKAIAAEEAEAMADYQRAMSRLRDKRAALLELTHQPAVVAPGDDIPF